MTVVDRASRCILGWSVVEKRTQTNMQACLDQGPRAKNYYSDDFPIYARLSYYPGYYWESSGKEETYTVEGVNAELRHYLARLHRRARCFSKNIDALRQAIKIFVFYHNHRQMKKFAYPQYFFNLTDAIPCRF